MIRGVEIKIKWKKTIIIFLNGGEDSNLILSRGK